MNIVKYIFLIVMLVQTCKTWAQDHIYSQFFGAPVYFNPALTGQFEGDLRVSSIYRNQWSGLSGDLSYLSASVDVNIPEFGGGFGLMFTRSSEGVANLVKNNVAGTYAYSVGGDDFVASFGVQAGITNRRADWNNLVFSDQIDMRLGFMPGVTSSAALSDVSNVYYFDAAGGANFVYRSIMVGAAVHHINKPDESFTGTQAKLPMRLSAHASWRIPLSTAYQYNEPEAAFLIPSLVYYKQAGFNSISAGAQIKYKSVNAGVWYRGAGQTSQDAIVLSFIFDIFSSKQRGEKIRVGVSHDATLSKINYTNTSGSTEASVGFEKYFPNSSGYNKFNGLRSYDFY
ncbi:MAG: type IX secretion system membrane protein PorP/SprF [Sphingobacteriales bacterium]|nr:MAG: type IX secretion system membrane protein PorP/SprF [Sphingobacteriales bacterium]